MKLARDSLTTTINISFNNTRSTFLTWYPFVNFQSATTWTNVYPFLFPRKYQILHYKQRKKKITHKGRNSNDQFHLLITQITSAANEPGLKIAKKSEIAPDFKHPFSYAKAPYNYHFLTRSTESITRLTSSFARLRVSRRIIPLRFIMAMVANSKFPDFQIWGSSA